MTAAWLIWLCGGSLHGQVVPTANKPAARDAVTDAQLREQFAAAGKLVKQMASKSRPLDGNRPNVSSTLYTKSVILFDGEKHTVVPIGSILHLPESLRDRVIAKPEGDFTYWPNFLKRNSAWVAAKEVPLKMAKGDRESARMVLNGLGQESRVLVAVYKNGPISILEPTTPPRNQGGATSNRR